MQPPIISRSQFVVFVLALLMMGACAAPAVPAQPPVNPPTQPPVTVLVVVTATPDQPAVVPPTATATATPKPVVIEPTATFTSKPPTASPTAPPTSPPPTFTPTSKPPTASPTATPTSPPPTFTPTSKPPTPRPTLAPTRPPTRTLTPSPSATPGPHTRTLYSNKALLDFSVILPLGDKGDKKVLSGRLLPQGCQIVDVQGIDYHFTRLNPPAAATANHGSHGWTITRLSSNPRDLGVNVHWWYNAGSMIQLRVVYTVREPWDVDCNVPGLTQIEP